MDESLQQLVQQIREGIVVKDRKWMLKTFPKCFVGSELVDWMVENNHVSTRADAVAIGQTLLMNQVFMHVTKDHPFKDEHLFYRFKEDFKVKERVSSDPNIANISQWGKELFPMPENGNSQLDVPNGFFHPEIPNGFVEAGMEGLFDQLLLSPMDEHNIKLLSNVHPPNWMDPKAERTYNMIVIGAGAGGLVTAAGSAGVGAKVGIIEKNLLGGDCLNYGCVPSKALLGVAKSISQIRKAASKGVTINGEISVDFPAIMERMRRLRANISKNDSAERFESLGVDVFIGHARFVARNKVQVNEQVLKFKKACIATGAKAALPNIPGLEGVKFLTNESIFNLTELPRKLVIIGTGSVGCEMAQAFANFGSQVTLLGRSKGVLTREEKEAGEIIENRLKDDGVDIKTEVSFENVEYKNGEIILTVKHLASGDVEEINTNELLLAVGRSPNVNQLGLEEAGVEYDSVKGIKVNDLLQTSNKNIYAVGDCCNKFKFTHVADFMARIVIRNALFFGNAKFSALVLPWATYTFPELAHVGLYEHDLIKRNILYDTFSKHFNELDRALLEGEEGYIKVFTKKGTDKILGCTIVGPRAGDLISEVCVAITNDLGLSALALSIHPYPTEAECIRHMGDMFNRTRLTPSVRVIFRGLLMARRK